MLNGKQRGFTLIEILVVVTIIGVLAGLVVVLIPRGQFEAKKVDCINNIRNIVSSLELEGGNKYPKHTGPNLILYLVNKGVLQGEEAIKLLFCPGDEKEDLKTAGGVKAYDDVELKKKGEWGGLTSYAGRDQQDANCAARKGGSKPVVLVCDDSEDHHEEKGLVVGLTGGSTQWRDKFDDYNEMRQDTPLVIGVGSSVEELKCLRAE